MSLPLLLATEKGYRSVSAAIKNGKIAMKFLPTPKELEKVLWDLQMTKDKPSALILDGVTALQRTAIADVKMEKPTSIWDKRYSITPSQQDWGVMSSAVISLLRLARAQNVPLIITAHEGIREDVAEGIDRHFPDLNKQLLGEVVNNSDAVIRLYVSNRIVEADGVKLNPGARLARISPNEQYYAKTRITDEFVGVPPPVLGVPVTETSWAPVIKRLREVAGEPWPFEEAAVVYGQSGVGKTRFAVELAVSFTQNQLAKAS